MSWFNKKLGRWMVHADGRQMYRYRWVMEQHLGRPLAADEHVHHINGDPTDDRLENLRLIAPDEHGRMHAFESVAVRGARVGSRWHPGESCVACGKDDRPHYSLGMCDPCYQRDYRKRREQAA